MSTDLIVYNVDTHIQDIQPFEARVPPARQRVDPLGTYETVDVENYAYDKGLDWREWWWTEDVSQDRSIANTLAHTGTHGALMEWMANALSDPVNQEKGLRGICLGGGLYGSAKSLDLSLVGAKKMSIWFWHERSPDSPDALPGFQEDLEIRFYAGAQYLWQRKSPFIHWGGGTHIIPAEKRWYLMSIDFPLLPMPGVAADFYYEFPWDKVTRFVIAWRHNIDDGLGVGDRQILVDDILIQYESFDDAEIILRSEKENPVGQARAKGPILVRTSDPNRHVSAAKHTILRTTKPPGKVY